MSTGYATRWVRSSLLLCPAALAAACAMPMENVVPPPQEHVALRCELPVLERVGETNELQEKGGIQIAVIPRTFECVRGRSVERHAVESTLQERLQNLNLQYASGNQQQKTTLIEETITPTMSVEPGALGFSIRITNKLSHVFRGTGVLVQFTVGGKTQQVDQSNYAELAGTIIPPRGEQTVSISGPFHGSLPDEATVGLLLYDVPTKTDGAGNVTERHSFEWYFKRTTNVVQEEGVVTKTRVWY